MLNQFKFLPFREFVADHANFAMRREAQSVLVRNIDLEADAGEIHAMVLDAGSYHVDIDFDDDVILDTSCNCSSFRENCCQHIVRVLMEADLMLAKQEKSEIPTSISPIYQRESEAFLLKDLHWLNLNQEILNAFTSNQRDYYWYDEGTWLDGDYGILELTARFKYMGDQVDVWVKDDEAGLHLKCSCAVSTKKLCYHLVQVLKFSNKRILQVVFDQDKRQEVLQRAGSKYGLNLSNEELEDLFRFVPYMGELLPKPRVNLTPVSPQLLQLETSRVLNRLTLPWEEPEQRKNILVLNYNPYHQDLSLQIMKAKVAKSGALKSPIVDFTLADVMAVARTSSHTLFYQSDALVRNRSNQVQDYEQADLFQAYRNLVLNEAGLEIYLFDNDGGKITPNKLEQITIKRVDAEVLIFVNQKGDFYEITGKVKFDNRQIATNSIRLVEQFFFRYDKQFYFMDALRTIHLLDYFARNNHRLFVHKEQFEAYKSSFLDEMENHFSVNYALVRKPAVKQQALEANSELTIQKLVYLSESDNYILITPAIRYGDRELPLFSKRNLYVNLPDGSVEEKPRNEWLERGFSKLIRELHPTFSEDNGYDFVYLSRQEFLESGWFLDAFERLRADEVQLFGFNELSKNRFNAHKPTVTTSISSGIDWFDVKANIQFGNQTVSLEQVQRAILKRSSFVELGDGTQGILPEEWVDRFGKFFRSGEISADFIRIHKTNFQLIDDLFREEAIDHQVRETLNELTGKLNDFHSISTVKIPKKLKATLRDYQKEGLNWLNFLDEFGFGGILADDMGLGKTLQIIAYILSQHEKGRKDASLVVVPTSLIFNWRTELKKFAPHLKVLELWGTKRNTVEADFAAYDVVVISYGTLLSDIEHLRKYRFNLVVLDESQAIKNPNSKRYKAVRLLAGRQHLALTGTPIENNTFDLFAQLSFAMPGLLGSARSFLELYATPIDKFQEDKRASELQRRIHPFVLRRTKKQVAKELPEKTEMVLYCEMGVEQRKVYDLYRKEFIEQIQSKTDDDIRKNSALLLQGMTKLRQICDSPAILGDKEDYGGASAKLEELMNQINAKKDNHKILVFSQFVRMLNLIKTELEHEGIGFCYLTGETQDRQAQVDRFQNDDEARVFLISLKAGGTGLNLTEADYVYLVDPWWNPAVENQAIDRAYRIGQDKHVVAIRLVTPDSMEEKILELQSRKMQLADDLIHTDQRVMKSLSKADLMELVG